MFERFRKNRFGYSRWDGTQRIEGLDADDILKALSDDYMENANLQQALRRLMQDGIRSENGQRTMGLREMMERMRQQRSEQLNRYNMASGVMDDLRQKLEEIKQMEREGIQNRLDGKQPNAPTQQDQSQPHAGQQEAQGQSESQPQTGDPSQRAQSGQQSQASQQGQQGQSGQSGQGDNSELSPEQMQKMLEMIAQRKRDYLDKLPKDVPGQIKSLSEYDFMDDQAREKFKELLDSLQQQMMQQFFQGMQQSLQNMTPEDIAKMREMIRDLNKMLRERQEGREPDFDSFMQKHGEYFPGVNSLDDLIEQMQQQMAAMQGIMDSMSPEQRRELQNLMEQLMGDDRIRVDMMELAANLEALTPPSQRPRFRFRGSESLPLNEAMRMMGRLQQMEGLEDQFQEARQLDNVEAIDSQAVKELLGDEEYQSVEQLKELMQVLEDAGYIQRKGNRWELTARGIRKIGQKALQDIFNKMKRDGFGRHVSPFRGVGGERTDESKMYQFGDPFLLDLQKTLMNSLHRRQTIGKPVHLDKEDFEVYRTEFTTQSSTVLMIDMSLSMVYNNCQPAAKKVAVALESLIRSQFPRDNLAIVGFSRFAQEYKPEELVGLSSFDNSKGTNMAHGLMLARQILSRFRGVNKQVIMITDGGPTMWYTGESWEFMFPNPFAEQQTLLEAQRCTRDGITINTFMLYDDDWMIAFVDQMTKINHGRMFYVDKDNLGEYLLVDYLNSKKKLIS